MSKFFGRFQFSFFPFILVLWFIFLKSVPVARAIGGEGERCREEEEEQVEILAPDIFSRPVCRFSVSRSERSVAGGEECAGSGSSAVHFRGWKFRGEKSADRGPRNRPRGRLSPLAKRENRERGKKEKKEREKASRLAGVLLGDLGFVLRVRKICNTENPPGFTALGKFSWSICTPREITVIFYNH